ncbi:GP88 family protein [Yinghuangia sp. YIM S10712]|uniref:GP88 family protein n=1 Tax=Yinghuangia sp. YIM S10712 TaxID=3436930 RepID=UPI003F52EFD7
MVRPDPTPPSQPTRLLRQNRELRAIGVWNWTLPAWAGRFPAPDGRTYNTCPSAGVCRHVCYARHGTYTWPAVRASHQANLRFVLDDLPDWQQAMTAELGATRFRGAWVRIHDSGDFFSDRYLGAWLDVIRARPSVNFYAYTKEVRRFRALVEPHAPENFLWVYSFGGTQDAELDPAHDRVADVFPDTESIDAAGWHSQGASDLLAVLGPRLVGIPANRIPHYLKRLRGRTFRSWQAEVDAERRTRRGRTAPRPSNVTPLRPSRPADNGDQTRAA